MVTTVAMKEAVESSRPWREGLKEPRIHLSALICLSPNF